MRGIDKYSFFFGAFILIIFMICSGASGDDTRVYTNDDLEPYERQYEPEKQITPYGKHREKYRKTPSRRRHVDQQEYWCKRGTDAQEKVDLAKEKLAKAEEYSSEKRFKQFQRGKSKSREATPDQKLEKARENLMLAERAYRKIDDEAHRKGIPPGWLRCQF